ncbi:MAG: 16S rRNA (cytosine(1402)-N(4))-methyltransferase RsmH [Actinomycetaceae bacterium]|nr:16S rRNA (cytosine(1402)-N(4))-methyltransferase RsmH [Actinomycetaceae bacterium]
MAHVPNASSTRDVSSLHQPVLVDDVLALLAPALDGRVATLIDCTVGMGGHSEAILQRWPSVSIIGIDRDPIAIELASTRLEPFGDRFRTVHATYDAVAQVARDAGVFGKIDAVLMDLGVSSLQLDDDERGFAYARDTSLDMRMDQSRGRSAAELIETASAEELTRILATYGEERFAKRIAQSITQQRGKHPITTTGQLVDIVRQAIPAPARRTGGNPAKRTFQALRIAVNEELDILERALPAALSTLRIGGRLVVESYHSLEDRIVKTTFRNGSEVQIPPDLPIVPDNAQPALSLITRKAIQADAAGVAHNPRAASVRLRAAEIIRPYSPPSTSQRNTR